MIQTLLRHALFAALALVWGCESGPGFVGELQATPHYGESVAEFSPGEGAGFGQDGLPQVVTGGPQGKGELAGGVDVVSLGVGGVIVLSFGGATLVDGPGPDLAVYENAFFAGGDPEKVFAELGEVSVSMDGEHWEIFPCDPTTEGPQWPGCAGFTPTFPCDGPAGEGEIADCGGDLFDLATLGVAEAKFVRIRDLTTDSAGIAAGFDLDAIALLHWTAAH